MLKQFRETSSVGFFCIAVEVTNYFQTFANLEKSEKVEGPR